jgi:DNA-binding response OmpR family regulator
MPTTLTRHTRHAMPTDAVAPVLVVEDDEMVGEMLIVLLEAEGYVTALARDGETAIRLARQIRPSLITLDLQLPLMSGHGVLESLAANRRTRQIPVVVFSSDVSELTPTRQVRKVLVKPDGIMELANVVRALVRDVAKTA